MVQKILTVIGVILLTAFWVTVIGAGLPLLGVPVPWESPLAQERHQDPEVETVAQPTAESAGFDERVAFAVQATVTAWPTSEPEVVEVIVTATPTVTPEFIAGEAEVVLESASSDDPAPSAALPEDDPTQVLVPTVTNKRWDEIGYEEFIWFDIAWDTSNLRKETRAIKGLMVFADLFGEPMFAINYTIDDPVVPGQPFSEQGMGFDYNRYNDDKRWVRETDLDDMDIYFVVRNIIYQDGERETIPPPEVLDGWY